MCAFLKKPQAKTMVRKAYNSKAAGVILTLCGLSLLIDVPAAAAKTALRSTSAQYASLGKNIDDVDLLDVDGRSVQWRKLNGAPRAVFFGFTMCPEVCPTTIAALEAARAGLREKNQDIKVDFVTLDPARDRPEMLKSYVGGFTKQIRAYSGSSSKIAKIASAFRVSYQRVDYGGGEYSLDHTAVVYLLDRRGNVVDVLPYGMPPQKITERLEKLLALDR